MSKEIKYITDNIKKVLIKNGYKANVYITGSLGRNEIRENGEYVSDIDILIIIKDEKLLNEIKYEIDKSICKLFSSNHKISLVYSLKNTIEKNYLSNLVLSTNFNVPIYEEFKLEFSEKCNKNQLLLNNHIQCIIYYLSKYGYYKDEISMYKANINAIKSLILLEDKILLLTEIELFEYLLKKEYKGLEELVELSKYFKGESTVYNREYLIKNFEKVLIEIVYKLSDMDFEYILESVKYTFSELDVVKIKDKCSSYEKIFSIVQGENLGVKNGVVDYEE